MTRFVVWHPDGGRRLEYERGDRRYDDTDCEDARRIIRDIREDTGLRVTLVRVDPGALVEAELVDGAVSPPDGLTWHTCRPDLAVETRPPWNRPGWIRRALDEIDPVLERAGDARRGPPEQIRHTSTTGILRIPTRRSSVWLKAVPAMFSHEGTLIEWLSRRHPAAVPRVVANGRYWWLSEQFPPERGRPERDPLVLLARVQIDAVDHVPDLRSLGVTHRPLAGVAAETSLLARRDDLLGAADRRSLSSRVTALERSCDRVAALGYPETLVHGDVHPGNLRWTGRGWFLFDWTDACVTNPLVDLALPLSYETGPERVRRAALFAAPWREVVPPRRVAAVLHDAASVGAAHQALSYRWILDELARSDTVHPPRLVDYLAFWVRRLVDTLS